MALDYILRIADTAGNQMISSRRKTGFIAFLAAIRSIEGIFHDWVEKEKIPTKNHLTFKLSQDHLELFFGAVRSCEGFKNNVTQQVYISI